jgi:hypothetical protein
MTLRRSPILLIAALLATAAPATAQTFQPAPSQGFGQPAPPMQQQQPPCMNDFVRLRTDTEKKAAAVRAASERHATPQEACKLFNVFIAAEDAMIKFIKDNSSWCGIPPQVLTQMQQGHVAASGVRTRVCQLAARPQGPAAPSLSDALGANSVPSANNIKSGRGTYDTLTGTTLGK